MRVSTPPSSKPSSSRRTKDKASAPRDWKIHLSLRSRGLGIRSADLRKMLTQILRVVDSEVAPLTIHEIHVLVVSDAQMRTINFEFRDKDKPTDVLSFPQFDGRVLRGEKRLPVGSGTYLGDLVIATETTIRQAKYFGVTKRAELARLLVHGVLHLCGYDHEGVPANEAARMRRRERAILGQMGITRR